MDPNANLDRPIGVLGSETARDVFSAVVENAVNRWLKREYERRASEAQSAVARKFWAECAAGVVVRGGL